MERRPPRSSLFPYTTLVRSHDSLWKARRYGAEACSQRNHADQRLSERGRGQCACHALGPETRDRKSTRLNSSHANISYAVFCLKKTVLCLMTDEVPVASLS